MSCFKTIKWEIVPLSLPVVKRNCPKCANNTAFKSSEKFRVNANKKNVDIWLIYQCEKCKSTWNMALYERINPANIDPLKYQLFLSNDLSLAKKYGFDIAIHHKNKVKLNFNNIDYNIIGEEINMLENNKIIIEISCKYPIGLRVDTVLSKKLGISREKIKMLYKHELISGVSEKDLYKKRINKKINICIKLPFTDAI